MPFLLLSPGEIKLAGYALTDVAQFGVQILNFSIFLGLLIFFLKVPAAQFFRNRQDELRRLLDQSERDRLEGEQQIQELQIKMEGLQSELDQLLARAEHDANREKEMIIQ
ncbi:MAG: synthase, partial [Acidobacteriota bacterium]